MTRLTAFALVALLVATTAHAEDPPASSAGAMAFDQELGVIRDQLVALKIEEALAAVNEILERPGISEDTRAVALDLRAQAHVAGDDVEAAEKDYRLILQLRPGYAPRREVTSKKAIARFAKLRAAMVGTVHCEVYPHDVAVMLDGRPIARDAGASFAALAGDRRVLLTRKGFDDQEVEVRVVAGAETLLKVQLVPNARTLVVRTDVDGVAVAIDGVASGVTAMGGSAGAEAQAEAVASLVLDDVAIGEHELRLTKSCFAAETLQEAVSVDLSDRAPKLTRIITMRPARSRVTAVGADYVGELRVDGERVASLPLTSFTMCPGVRVVEAIASGRVVWSDSLDAEEADITLDLSPRPNVVLVGSDWPKGWAEAFASWSRRDRLEQPPNVDLTVAAGWKTISLPGGTDLAVGVIPRAGVAGEYRVVMYGPILNRVVDGGVPPQFSRPKWRQASAGVDLVDGSGSVFITAVTPDGPGARSGLLAGDRLVAVSGRGVSTARSAKDTIAAFGIDAKLELDVISPGSAVRTVSCTTIAAPSVAPSDGDDADRMVRSAWESVEAAAAGPDAPAALAELAAWFEGAGRDDEALDAWRRVRATGQGVLRARSVYALGIGLQVAGRDADAREAFEQARAEALAARDARLAAAAADRLADLGVSKR